MEGVKGLPSGDTQLASASCHGEQARNKRTPREGPLSWLDSSNSCDSLSSPICALCNETPQRFLSGVGVYCPTPCVTTPFAESMGQSDGVPIPGLGLKRPCVLCSLSSGT